MSIGDQTQPLSGRRDRARRAFLEPLMPPDSTFGRPRKTDLRDVVDGIYYRNRNGCTWRALPHDFPPWRSVYNDFTGWAADGTWQVINDAAPRPGPP